MKYVKQFKFDYSEDGLGAYDFITSEITINPKDIKDKCSVYGIDFHTLLLHVINHEYLHHILFVDHGHEAGGGLDYLINDDVTNEKFRDYWLS